MKKKTPARTSQKNRQRTPQNQATDSKNDTSSSSSWGILGTLSAVVAVWLAVVAGFFLTNNNKNQTPPAERAPLPVLDALFPHQSLDTALENYPILISNYAEVEDYSNSTKIPTIYRHDKDTNRDNWAITDALGLISLRDLESILSPPQGPVPEHDKDYMMVKKQVPQDGDEEEDEYTGSLPYEMVSDRQRRFEAVQRGGFSLLINEVQARWKPVRDFARRIEQELEPEHVSVNLYMTPPSSTESPNHQNCAGFATHWDWMDVIVIQIQGTKVWSVAQHPMISLPTEDQSYSPNKAEVIRYMSDSNVGFNNEDIHHHRFQDIVMRPGDVLYIPRGFMHNASTFPASNREENNKRGASLHLTFGIEHGCQTTVEALMHHAIEEVANYNQNLMSVAIHRMNCGGHKDVTWKNLFHLVVAEVARRDSECQFDDNVDSCVFRQSVPLHPTSVYVASQRKKKAYKNKSFNNTKTAVMYSLLQDAFSYLLDKMDPHATAEFIARQQVTEEDLLPHNDENIDMLCHPYLRRDETSDLVACYPDSIKLISRDSLREYAQQIVDASLKDFEKIQQGFENHITGMRKAIWDREDGTLRALGQL